MWVMGITGSMGELELYKSNYNFKAQMSLVEKVKTIKILSYWIRLECRRYEGTLGGLSLSE